MRVRNVELWWLYASIALGACGDDAAQHQPAAKRSAGARIPVVESDASVRSRADAAQAIGAGYAPDASPDSSWAKIDAGESEPTRDASTAPAEPVSAAAGSGALSGAQPLPNPLPDLHAGVQLPHMLDDAGDEVDAGPDPSRPSSCSGKPGAPGNSTRMATGRAFIVHMPPTADPNHPLPVMFAFHGAGGKGADMQTATSFDTLADLQPVVMVYPDGAAGNAPWNVGRNVCPPGNFVSTTNDDVAYLDAMLDDIERDQCIDRSRIFVTGFSMGGYFSNELGCRLGRQRLRAIAPHSGGAHSGSCAGPLPVLVLHGDADSLVNYRCGTQARDYWIQRNGCSEASDTLAVTGGECVFQRDCKRDAPVVMCTFKGMDHTWAFPPMYEHASWLIWTFFSAYF